MVREFRVIRNRELSGTSVYVVHQVRYDEQGTVQQVSADPVSPSRGTLEELRDDLERIMQALELPPLPGDQVLDSVEMSSALIYGTWLGEQIRECAGRQDGDSAPGSVSQGGSAHTGCELLEAAAERFAEARRKGTLREDD